MNHKFGKGNTEKIREILTCESISLIMSVPTEKSRLKILVHTDILSDPIFKLFDCVLIGPIWVNMRGKK